MRQIFQIYNEGTRAKAQLFCYVVTILSFSDSRVLKFEVKDNGFIRIGYGFGRKTKLFGDFLSETSEIPIALVHNMCLALRLS